MDNKALAEFIRTELSKVISAVNKLAIKIASLHAPREQNDASPTPHHATTHENNTASRESTLLTQVPPAPSNSPQTQERWYKTLDGWKAALEIVAIPFAIGYAIVTGLQWYDLRHNFQVDERAWIKVETLYPPQPTADFGVNHQRFECRKECCDQVPDRGRYTTAQEQRISDNGLPGTPHAGHTGNNVP